MAQLLFSSLSSLSFIFFLLNIASSEATFCERCVYQAKAAPFPRASALSGGSCGYGSMAIGFNHGHIAAAMPSLYRDGAGCGACFQIRCKNSTLCSPKGTTVTVTDLNRSNETEFVLSRRALRAMARNGMDHKILKQGIVEVEYKRVPCDYKKKNLAVRVQESSKKPNYLAIEFLYQGGQTEIVNVNVAQVGTSNYSDMRRSYGAVWDTKIVPSGPLQLRMQVASGYDGLWVWAPTVLPADWVAGSVYDSGIQITDISFLLDPLEGCDTCDDQTWN